VALCNHAHDLFGQARELETDQYEKHFDAMLKKVAQAKHVPHDEAVERAGKGAMVRPKKRAFPYGWVVEQSLMRL
jgi:hypothetical protein